MIVDTNDDDAQRNRLTAAEIEALFAVDEFVAVVDLRAGPPHGLNGRATRGAAASPHGEYVPAAAQEPAGSDDLASRTIEVQNLHSARDDGTGVRKSLKKHPSSGDTELIQDDLFFENGTFSIKCRGCRNVSCKETLSIRPKHNRATRSRAALPRDAERRPPWS